MNWDEFKYLFANSEIMGNKIILKENLFEALDFLKTNYT